MVISSILITSRAEVYDPSSSVFRFQQQMAKRGNAESQFKLGLMYETGSGIEPSQTRAISWYIKAAEQNYKPASNRLTYLDIKKSGFNSNHKEWLQQLKSDARFNEGEALFLLGQMYSEGTGVHKSLTLALSHLRKAKGGNIPGSEAEIARVEQELAELQGQYITEDEKKKTTPVIIIPVKKTATKITHKSSIPVKSGITKTTSSKTPKPKKIQNIAKTEKTATIKTTEKKMTKSTARQNKTLTSRPKTPIKAVIKQETHPMDTICGGRNRFSRNCR